MIQSVCGSSRLRVNSLQVKPVRVSSRAGQMLSDIIAARSVAPHPAAPAVRVLHRQPAAVESQIKVRQQLQRLQQELDQLPDAAAVQTALREVRQSHTQGLADLNVLVMELRGLIHALQAEVTQVHGAQAKAQATMDEVMLLLHDNQGHIYAQNNIIARMQQTEESLYAQVRELTATAAQQDFAQEVWVTVPSDSCENAQA